jgi:hypothetical protein
MRLAKTLTAMALVTCCAGAFAKLPAPSDEAKAAAAATAAKTAWGDKVAAYQLCQTMDKVANGYRKTAGKEAAAAVATPACTDPGPFAAPAPAAQKPLEAAGAHSPAATATSPPSVNATSGQLAPKK